MGVVLTVLASSTTFAAVQSVAQFLKVSGSSRQDSLGGSYTAVRGQADALGRNPASIYGIQGLNANVTYFALAEGINYFKGFVGSASRYGTFGFSMTNIDSGAIESTSVDASGNVTTNGRIFGVSGQAFAVSYSNVFAWNMATGVSLKYVREDFATRTFNTVAFDMGAQKEFWHDRILTGVSFLNLGPGNRRSDGTGITENLPMSVRLGLGFKAYQKKDHEILFLTDTTYNSDDQVLVGTGLEYVAFNLVSARFGYSPVSLNQKFSFGLGLQTRIDKVQYALDYALQNNSDLGWSNRFTVKVSTGASFQAAPERDSRGNAPQSIEDKINALPDHQKNTVYVKVILVDSTELKGKVILNNSQQLVLEMKGFGAVTAPKKKIREIIRISNLDD